MFLVACALLAFAVTAVWRVRPKPGPVSDSHSPTWKLTSAFAEPLTGRSFDDCTLTEGTELRKHGRIIPTKGSGVAAACKYVTHLEGWPKGEDECILEFPVDSVQSIWANTLGARLAGIYYSRQQGGIMVFSGPKPGRRFIALDARWCRWGAVANGLSIAQ